MLILLLIIICARFYIYYTRYTIIIEIARYKVSGLYNAKLYNLAYR